MTITLTEAAARQIRTQIAKHGKGLALRVGVKAVGCSGLAYTYALADEVGSGDVLFEGQDAKLVVDPKTLAIIDGARLDFVTEGLKQSFRLENPNADSTCGCGESFNLKANAAGPRGGMVA
ncbi:MAG: iron-sulfur cluster assembly accessory protein [Casimicrobiaceae bacterium]